MENVAFSTIVNSGMIELQTVGSFLYKYEHWSRQGPRNCQPSYISCSQFMPSTRRQLFLPRHPRLCLDSSGRAPLITLARSVSGPVWKTNCIPRSSGKSFGSGSRILTDFPYRDLFTDPVLRGLGGGNRGVAGENI